MHKQNSFKSVESKLDNGLSDREVVSLKEVRNKVFLYNKRLPVIKVALQQLRKHVSAKAVYAKVDYPRFNNSAVDGYALISKDTEASPVDLKVVGTSFAGSMSSLKLKRGQALRIMTGAPIPDGADAVCKKEATTIKEKESEKVTINMVVKPGENIRLAGEDFKIGDLLVNPHQEIRSQHLGMLAGAGISHVYVFKKAKVGVMSTGSEIKKVGSQLKSGEIWDSNRLGLMAMVEETNCEVMDLGIVKDDKKLMRHRIEDAFGELDMIILTGGVSVGEADFAFDVLNSFKEAHLNRVQIMMKPGKPLVFGSIGSQKVPVFALPGNPSAAMVSFELFVRPMLRYMIGYNKLDRPIIKATLKNAIGREKGNHIRILRVRLDGSSSRLEASLVNNQGSHSLTAIAQTDGFVLIKASQNCKASNEISVFSLRDSDSFKEGQSVTLEDLL